MKNLNTPEKPDQVMLTGNQSSQYDITMIASSLFKLHTLVASGLGLHNRQFNFTEVQHYL
jgi:hypothetical protein